MDDISECMTAKFYVAKVYQVCIVAQATASLLGAINRLPFQSTASFRSLAQFGSLYQTSCGSDC
jgi:hypothetical protein